MRPGASVEYWAGVLDTAGCIRMKKTPAGRVPHVSVRSATIDLPARLAYVFGGKALRTKRGTYLWSRSHKMALDVLLSLRPAMQRCIDPKVFEWVPGHVGTKRVGGAKLVRLLEGE